MVIDNAPAQEFVAANAGLTILDTEYANEDYAIGVAKDNTALLDAVNEALAELKADGTIQSIIDKYIPAKLIASRNAKRGKGGHTGRPFAA